MCRKCDLRPRSMYLTPGGTIVNRSQFRKYGIKVAELVATLHRLDDTDIRKAA